MTRGKRAHRETNAYAYPPDAVGRTSAEQALEAFLGLAVLSGRDRGRTAAPLSHDEDEASWRLLDGGSEVTIGAVRTDRGWFVTSMSRDVSLDPPGTGPDGTVWIACDDGAVHGYWDGHPERAPGVVERLPPDLSVLRAARWGLERTARVLVRRDGDGYWAVDRLDPVQDIGVQRLLGVVTLADLAAW